MSTTETEDNKPDIVDQMQPIYDFSAVYDNGWSFSYSGPDDDLQDILDAGPEEVIKNFSGGIQMAALPGCNLNWARVVWFRRNINPDHPGAAALQLAQEPKEPKEHRYVFVARITIDLPGSDSGRLGLHLVSRAEPALIALAAMKGRVPELWWKFDDSIIRASKVLVLAIVRHKETVVDRMFAEQKEQTEPAQNKSRANK